MGFGGADGFAGFDESAWPVLQQMDGQTEQFMPAASVQQLGLFDPGRIRGRYPDPFGNPGSQRISMVAGGEQTEHQHQDAEIDERVHRAIGPEWRPTGSGDVEQPLLVGEIAGIDLDAVRDMGEIEVALPATNRPFGHGTQNLHRFAAAGAAIGQQRSMPGAGGDEAKAPGQPQIRNAVLPQAGRAELLAEGALGILGAGERQPIQLVAAVILLEDQPGPTGEGGLTQGLCLDSCALGQRRLEVRFDIAVEIARPGMGAGLCHPVQFSRRQSVARRKAREPG